MESFIIGSNIKGGDAASHFSGQMSNFLIYTEALTAEEIQSNYNAGRKEYGLLDNEYIQQGMLAQYDGINNTGRGHNIESKIWKDLSGNGYDVEKAGTEEISWEENNYHFSKTINNYFDSTGKQMDLGSKARTIEIVYSLEVNVDQRMLGLGTMETNKLQDVGYLNGGFNCQGYGTGANEGIGITYEQGKVYSSSWTYTGGKANYRTNGDTKENVSFPTLNTTATRLSIGRGNGGVTGNENFKIYAVRIYDRVLTTEEMKYNYEIDKKRFNMVSNLDYGVPIPDGFYYVGGTKESGLVISDNPADENLGEGQMDVTVTLAGNQFVWIPVEADQFSRTTWSNNAPTGSIGTSYTEPSSVITEADETGEKAEYEAMKTSVLANGGFFVGRYEAGCATQRTSSNKTTAQTVLVQKDKFVYNYVPWGASLTSIENASNVKGAVKLAREMYPASNANYGVVSHLMYGIQWDSILRFIADETNNVTSSTSWGNYNDSTGAAATNSGSLQTTGKNEAWKVKNMYDIAGNTQEWTMEEASSYCRIVRGGRYGSSGGSGGASIRQGGVRPDFTYDYLSFRPVLYIKN